MKKILLAIFIMIPILTSAKEDTGQIMKKPVQCFDPQALLYTIDIEFKEKVDFFYPNEVTKGKTQIVMFSSKETGSWTLIELSKKVGCVLAAGHNTPT